MLLTTQQAREIQQRFGVYAKECCDRCTRVLGPVRYTRAETTEVFCSQECRGDGDRQVIRRGGRPRKYRNPQEARNAKVQLQRLRRNSRLFSATGALA